jgi:hypothetical protein
MFPLPRHKVDYTTKEIGFIIQHVSALPPFQRAKNELHVQTIYQSMKQYLTVHKDVMCTGSISFAMYQSEWWLLDGQHRVRALQQLAKEYPEIHSISLRTDVYHVDTFEQMENLYRLINETKKVDMFRSSVPLQVWPRVEEWFQKRFSSYWKDSLKPNLLNVSRDEVKKRMEAEGWLEKPVDQVIGALEQMNTYFSTVSTETWLEWGFTFDPKRMQLLQRDGFYFGVFRRYEWISRLFASAPVAHFSLEKKRQYIPKKIRNDVWNKQFAGQMTGHCFCCTKVISFQDGFHCGHVVSVHEGGTNVVANLEVVCEECNLDMSTMNMHTYKSYFHFV